MRYIAHLIRHQGKDVPVLDLDRAVNPPDQEAIKDSSALSAEQLNEDGLSVSGLGDAGELMTPEGQQYVRAHLRNLQDRIEDAQERGDIEKQAELEEKRDHIASYLTSAFGIGGRARKASSPIEQIRKNVTGCIRRAIRNVESKFPELGHHLHYSIKTGTYCQYAPIPKAEWHFEPR